MGSYALVYLLFISTNRYIVIDVAKPISGNINIEI